jgi:hypothetical protein
VPDRALDLLEVPCNMHGPGAVHLHVQERRHEPGEQAEDPERPDDLDRAQPAPGAPLDAMLWPHIPS